MARRQLSANRKAAYYAGLVIVVVGALVFFSVFVTGACHFGDFTDFEARARSQFTRAVVGMALMVVGIVTRGIARAGVAGSGLKPDPEQARRDVEPWSRMTGGVLKDVLDEAGVKLGKPDGDDALSIEERLQRLDKLRDEKVITAEEHEVARARILKDL